MTTLLISGSRAATPAMLDYARRAVARAYSLGWTIVVGDAVGVDSAVAKAATALHHHHPHVQQDAANAELYILCRVFGLNDDPRNGAQGIGIRYERLSQVMRDRTQITKSGHMWVDAEVERITNYYQRDLYILSLADKVLCIWNGRSLGTHTLYQAARAKGIEAWLVTPP